MTNDEIRAKAKESGEIELLDFVHLAIHAEREGCHNLRQTIPNPYLDCQVSAHAYDMAISDYAAAIRARGKV